MEGNAITEALAALRSRGVDTAEQMLEVAEPEQILEACERWDRRENVGGGLLVAWIRAGEFTDPEPTPAATKQSQLRDRHQRATERWPLGSSPESHAQLIARRWPVDLEYGDVCAGRMRVVLSSWPSIDIRCDVCGFEAGVGAREAHLLGTGVDVPVPEPILPF